MALAQTLTDDFNDNSLNTGLWTAYADAGTSLAEANNRLELTLRANGTGYVGVFGTAQFDLTGSSFLVECLDPGTGGSGQTSSLEIDYDAANSLKVLRDGTGIMAQTVIAGANNSFGITTYSAVTHRWWRIREAGGSVYFETSPTGRPGSWTVLYSRTNPFALTAVTPKLFGGCYASVATPGVVKFDNFNLGGPGQIALPDADWSVGGWTTHTGATTNLHQQIDEPDFNDADYIQSVPGPSSDTALFTLSNPADPLSSAGHTLSVRAWLDTAGPPATLRTDLLQNAAALSTPATWTDPLTTTPTRFDHLLSAAQADAISNYGDLYAYFVPNQPAPAPTPPNYQAAGANQSGTTAALTVPWPTGGTYAVGDIGLLFVEAAAGIANTLTTPNGFVQIPGAFQSTGTSPAGTRLTVFWCRATSTSMASPVVGGTADHSFAAILTFRNCIATGDPFDTVAGSVKAGASTSSTLPGVITTVPGCLIVHGVARDIDNAAGQFSAQSNANLTGLAERYDLGTNAGGGGGVGVFTGVLPAAGASGTTTVTMSSGITAHVTIALKPVPVAPAASRVRVSWAALIVPAPPVFKNLTGGSSGSSGTSATLSKRVFRQLTGAATGRTTPSALLTRRRRLVGGASGQTAVTADLTKTVSFTYQDITGAAAGRSVVGLPVEWGGGATYGGFLWGDTITVITGGVPPWTYRDLAGAAAGTSAVTALPTRKRRLVAAAAGSSAVTATPTRRRPLVAASVGRATVTATPGRKRLLVASAAGLSSASAALSAKRRLVAASAGKATTLASIDIAGSVFRALFGTSAGKATSAGLTTRRRALVAAGVGRATLTATPTRRRPLIASTVGRATVSALIGRKRALLAASAGTATVIAVPTRKRPLTAISVGQATASGAVSIVTIPLTSVIWVVDHFEQGTVGTLVLWDTSVFQTSGDHAQVLWEEDVFKVYP